MVKKKIDLIFKLVLSCLIVGYVSLRVNWGTVGQSLLDVDLTFFLVSTLLAFISSFFIAFKYYVLTKGSVLDHSVSAFIRINLISRFYALSLPLGTARDAVRWYKVTQNKNGRTFFFACTVFERATFVLVLLIFGFGPLFFFHFTPEISELRDRIFVLIFAAFFLVCAVLAYFLFPVLQSFIASVLIRFLPAQRMRERVEVFFEGFTLQEIGTRQLFQRLLWLSLLWQAVFLCRIYTLFQATSIPLGIADAAWMGSLVLLLQMLPLSFAGIGIREGAYAYLFTLSGLAPEGGVLIGLLFFSQMLILAGIGGALEVRNWISS